MNIKMSLHPITFGVMIVVAAGTLIYHLWNRSSQEQHQHQQGYRNQNRGQEPFFNVNSPKPAISGESEDKNRSTKRKKKSDLCTICLGELCYELKALPCTHIFHENCITQWLKENDTCPVCRRRSTTQNNLSTLQA